MLNKGIINPNEAFLMRHWIKLYPRAFDLLEVIILDLNIYLIIRTFLELLTLSSGIFDASLGT